jgi:pimeloyl-ACP methyl ester carboxylesterase
MSMTVALAMTSLPRPGWLPHDVWPFKTMTLDVDRASIAVSEAGEGPVLLFYTGIGQFIWRDVITRLAPDFRCIPLDPPGIGFSAPVPRAEATLQNSAKAVGAVIDALDVRDFTLVAHDSGGPPSIAAVARRPRRIRGIVGVNTFGWRPSGAAFRGMLAVIGSGITRQISLSTGLLSLVTASSFGVGRHLDSASREAYRAGLQKSMSSFHDYLNDARTSDLYDELAKAFAGPLTHLPLLTIFGERNDPLKFQPKWKALYPDARQLVIPKGNHFPMCDDPNFVADQIRIWHRVEIGRTQERRS